VEEKKKPLGTREKAEPVWGANYRELGAQYPSSADWLRCSQRFPSKKTQFPWASRGPLGTSPDPTSKNVRFRQPPALCQASGGTVADFFFAANGIVLPPGEAPNARWQAPWLPGFFFPRRLRRAGERVIRPSAAGPVKVLKLACNPINAAPRRVPDAAGFLAHRYGFSP